MGRIEKVVVLSVLFLIAVIVTVSVYPREVAVSEAGRELALGEAAADLPENEVSLPMTRVQPPRVVRGTTPQASNALASGADLGATPQGTLGETSGATQHGPADPRPANARRRLPDPGGSAPPTTQLAGSEATGSEAKKTAAPASVLLSSAVEAEGAIRGPAMRVEADWDVVEVEGLRATWNDDFLVYTCAAGDDFARIARKVYRDENKVDLLRRNNEGVSSLSAGDEVWIPVRDDMGFVGNEHVVAEGESLWVIADRVYGEGRRWNEIFEANRDVLQQPDAVRAGMTLRIP